LEGGVVDASNTATVAARRDPRGAAAIVATVVILAVLLPLIIPVAIVLFLARSGEYVPRAIHWVGRKHRKTWAQ
jgi:hypothetical protein